MQAIFVLQSLFSIWMLVDAIRRGVPQYWYLVVLIPFGEVAYFIAVVLPDLQRTGKLKKWFSRPPSLAQLKLAYEETPSQNNRLRLAQGYHDAGKIAESGMLFEEVLETSPLEREALYGFAKCAWAAGEMEASVDALQTLVEHDLNYLDTVPAMELVEALWEQDRKPEALELAETLCRKSQRVSHRSLLANYYIALDRLPEAKKLLERALVIYETSPSHVKRRDRESAKTVKALLRQL